MSIKTDTDLIFRKQTLPPQENSRRKKINVLTEEDIKYYNKSKKYSDIDIKRLREADHCIIARKEGRPVHHTCIAVSQPFEHPRKELPINIGTNEGYVYNVKTETEYRGQGIASEVLKYIEQFAAKQGIKRIYADVDANNNASQKLFQKSGYERSGRVHHLQYNSLTFVVTTNVKFYHNSYKIPLFDLYISKYRSSRRDRIQSRISEYAAMWQEENESVVLFGAGNHAKEVLEVEGVKSSVSYAVDESTDKIGTTLSHREVPVRPLNALGKSPPDVIVICSRAFQQEMAARVEEQDISARILTLYPTVGYE